MSDWMLALSGPVAQRGPLLAALDRAGVDVEQEHGPRGLETDPTTGWITCRHPDVDAVATHAGNAGWSLRAHWPTPTCLACNGTTSRELPCLNCAGTGRTEQLPKRG